MDGSLRSGPGARLSFREGRWHGGDIGLKHARSLLALGPDRGTITRVIHPA